mmetsp:Transcript_14327/g.33354  ORF Transcript_14327/g.33354 Transcript_14327/m.33354 type:complete len:88 (+) Transcript_14327:193-456(+)
MSSIPNILTNKFVLTGIGKSVIKESSLIKPIFGAAGKMGPISSEVAPALEAAYPKLKKGFRADLNATRSVGFANLGKPNFILTNKYR